MKRLVVAACVSIAVAAIAAVSLHLWLAVKYGQFRHVGADPRYRCSRIDGIVRGEDIAVDQARQQAFISAAGRPGDAGTRGIYRIDLERENAVANITPSALPFELNPHGISLLINTDGTRSLFVIHHAAAGDAVIIFDVSDAGSLDLQHVIKGDALTVANDVVAIGRKEFYLTNSSRPGYDASSYFARMRMFLGWEASGNVVYFDGTAFRVVADGLVFANGINSSPDRNLIYVAELFANRLAVFSRRAPDAQLTRVASVSLPGSPDNIDVSPDGEVFIAAMPRAMEDWSHLVYGNAKRAPVQIVKVEPGSGWRVTPLWTDDGSMITTATVGAPVARVGAHYHFLVGTVADDHLLSCVANLVRNRAGSDDVHDRKPGPSTL